MQCCLLRSLRRKKISQEGNVPWSFLLMGSCIFFFFFLNLRMELHSGAFLSNVCSSGKVKRFQWIIGWICCPRPSRWSQNFPWQNFNFLANVFYAKLGMLTCLAFKSKCNVMMISRVHCRLQKKVNFTDRRENWHTQWYVQRHMFSCTAKKKKILPVPRRQFACTVLFRKC